MNSALPAKFEIILHNDLPSHPYKKQSSLVHGPFLIMPPAPKKPPPMALIQTKMSSVQQFKDSLGIKEIHGKSSSPTPETNTFLSWQATPLPPPPTRQEQQLQRLYHQLHPTPRPLLDSFPITPLPLDTSWRVSKDLWQRAGLTPPYMPPHSDGLLVQVIQGLQTFHRAVEVGRLQDVMNEKVESERCTVKRNSLPKQVELISDKKVDNVQHRSNEIEHIQERRQSLQPVNGSAYTTPATSTVPKLPRAPMKDEKQILEEHESHLHEKAANRGRRATLSVMSTSSLRRAFTAIGNLSATTSSSSLCSNSTTQEPHLFILPENVPPLPLTLQSSESPKKQIYSSSAKALKILGAEITPHSAALPPCDTVLISGRMQRITTTQRATQSRWLKWAPLVKSFQTLTPFECELRGCTLLATSHSPHTTFQWDIRHYAVVLKSGRAHSGEWQMIPIQSLIGQDEASMNERIQWKCQTVQEAMNWVHVLRQVATCYEMYQVNHPPAPPRSVDKRRMTHLRLDSLMASIENDFMIA